MSAQPWLDNRIRFPWAPLEAQLRRHLRPWFEDVDRDVMQTTTDDISVRIMADALGIHHGTLQHVRRDGDLSATLADRYCCAMGWHPAFIYGQLWWDYLLARVEFDEQREARHAQRRAANSKAYKARKKELSCA